MSRLPRHLEHLKAGFTAEAVSAASCRAFAVRAEREGKPNLAARWRRLAEAKDELAVEQLEAAGEVEGDERDLESALAEERYENEVLYPRLVEALGRLGHADEAALLSSVIERQRAHLEALSALRREVQRAAGGDVSEGGEP